MSMNFILHQTEAVMKGVSYYFDEMGEPTAVLIDVKKNPELWEDIVDILECRKRANQKPIPFEKVKADLDKKRKVLR